MHDQHHSPMPVLNPCIAHYGKLSHANPSTLFPTSIHTPHASSSNCPKSANYGIQDRSQSFQVSLERSQSAKARSSDISVSHHNYKQTYTPEDLIEKLIRRLPSELQNNIIELTNMMASSTTRLKILCDRQNIELREMQLVQEKQNADLHTSLLTCEVYKGRLVEMEQQFYSIKHSAGLYKGSTTVDPVDSVRWKGSSSPVERNIFQRGIVGNNNQELKQTEDNVGARWFSPDIVDTPIRTGSATHKTKSKTDSPLDTPTHTRSSSAVSRISQEDGPLNKPVHTRTSSGFSRISQEDGEVKNILNLFKDDQLKNALIKLTREKYKTTTRMKVLTNEVTELRSKLEVSELRQFQIALAEYTGDDNAIQLAFSATVNNARSAREKDYGPMDHIFKAMIEKRSINPVESILQFRRITEYMARLPGNLKIECIAAHLCSQEIMQIFDVDMICIYILELNAPNRVCKYTVRATKGEIFDISKSSIVREALDKGSFIRLADMKTCAHDIKLDGCPGILVRNILSMPLKEIKSGRTIGCINFLNKFEGKTAFTELDEVFASAYTDLASFAILGCHKFQVRVWVKVRGAIRNAFQVLKVHVTYRADVLTSILASSRELLDLLPDADSLFKKDREILPDEVLKALENCSLLAIKCYKVKAFLSSNHLNGSEDKEMLISLDEKVTRVKRLRKGVVPHFNTTSFDIGVAGFVAQSRKWLIQNDCDDNTHTHSDVDLDRHDMPCVTVPLLNVKGELIACLQMICGPGSPKFMLADSREDGITFEQAAQWFVQSISSPLQCILERMEKQEVKNFPIEGSLLTSKIRADPMKRGDSVDTAMKGLVEINHIEDQVTLKLGELLATRQGLGFIDVEKRIFDACKTDLQNSIDDNHKLHDALIILRKELLATQVFYNKAKKTIVSTPISNSTKAKFARRKSSP